MSLLDLLCKDVLLVEEKDDGGGGEVAVVADAVEEVQTLVHAVLGWNRGQCEVSFIMSYSMILYSLYQPLEK